MSGSLKGGLFVGGAVALGLLAAFLLPALVAGRETARGQRPDTRSLPAMPDIVGLSLDEAESELSRRKIAHVTDTEEVLGVVMPSVWEVCEAEPGPGQKIRGTARLRAALPGTCAI